MFRNHTARLAISSLFGLGVLLTSSQVLALSVADPVVAKGTVSYVVDGDTFDVTVHTGDAFERLVNESPSEAGEHIDQSNRRIRVRLASVDTAESTHPDSSQNTAEGRSISAMMRERLTDVGVSLRCFDTGYYGRFICNMAVDGNDLGAWLIKNDFSDYITEYGRDPFNHDLYRKLD